MSIITSASGKSVYRGYEYFVADKVLSYNKINDFEYEGAVEGSAQVPYMVHINLSKVRSSTCDCPFANGRKTCKHMVAVFCLQRTALLSVDLFQTNYPCVWTFWI